MRKSKNYLIGSRALALQVGEFNIKENTDYDVISAKPIPGFEFHDQFLLNNSEFDSYALPDPIIINGVPVYPINLKGLAIIKRSHLWRDLKFDRHIAMYHHHLAKHLTDMTDEDNRILQERLKMTYEKYGTDKQLSLKKTYAEFFNNAVKQVYDHDYLHTLVSHYDEPLYKRMQTPEHEVWCEKSLWDTFSFDDKCKAVAEETYVIALERFLIPGIKTYNKQAFLLALSKVCTTITKGWFRDFAIDNYPSIIDRYNNEILKSSLSKLNICL